VVETLLLLPELQPCRHPVLFAPVGAVIQPAEEAVQLAAVPNPETEEVTKVLLVPSPTPAPVVAMTAAVDVSVAVTVEVLNGETVEDF
jgi:hypothetical protein